MQPDKVLALGDIQYSSGAYEHFMTGYDQSWGAFKKKTRPTPGNHEYETPGASGYFRYFEVAGHYAFNIGRWHVVSLNTWGNIKKQAEWLRRNLMRSSRRCVLAFWHEPVFTSGPGDPDARHVRRWWRVLYRFRADVVLNGHDHNYQRWKRQAPSGRWSRRGIRQFVVGTGGREHLDPETRPRHVAFQTGEHLGVLKLVLRRNSYAWSFHAVSGPTLDRGKAHCS